MTSDSAAHLDRSGPKHRFEFAPATRAGGLRRLHDFVPAAGRTYAALRNHDYGPDNRTNVSALSPYIRRRLVLETEVLAAVLARHARSTSEKFIQEVFWRGYFKGYLENRPTIWTSYRRDVQRLRSWENLPRTGIATDCEAAVSARTGIDCFDAWVGELISTGYLHNHARMWFASIWIFTLKLPWQLGADLFLRHLIDADPASNTLSWRWVAGLHTKGKTYLARPDNIARFTDGRFEPTGLAPDAAPIEETELHPLVPIRPAEPPSWTAGGPVLLLATEEDCAPETLAGSLQPAAGLALFDASAHGTAAGRFSRGAMGDAAERARASFGVDVPCRERTDNWDRTIADAADAIGARTIVTAFTPVGPVRDRIEQARTSLGVEGKSMIEMRRRHDDLVWPKSTKGFFALKALIGSILDELDQERAPRLL